MVSREMGDILMITNDDELGNLAETVFKQEEAFMYVSDSQLEYINYLEECNEADVEVRSLLERCKAFNALSKKWSEITEAHIKISAMGESLTEQCHAEVEGPQVENSNHAQDCLTQAIDRSMERLKIEGPHVVNSKAAQDCLRQAIFRTMERLKFLLPKNWGGQLVMELEDEIEVAYAKFINLRKFFCGNHESELIKTSQGNHGGELIKTSQGNQGGELIKTSRQGNQGGELINTSQGGELIKTSQGNQGGELIKTSQGNQGGELIKADIAKDILDHVKYGINIGLQCVQNCRSRTIWIRGIAMDFEMLVKELEGLDVQNENDMRRLAENLSLFKQCIEKGC